ncbi:Phosphoserine aminotransferase [Geodia barretti]|uniref:phosphoserine transaminase n=1 Tax=Geodia barretti TaxID=519541 RepID=A0AA35TMJ6_GEOBA|nr:Phosphoserine aminotransferase [Geodia barretti]
MSLTRKRENTINFSPGPAALPDEVVREARENVMNYKGLGLGVMELSHRSPEYTALNLQTQDLLRSLLHIPSNYQVLFQQGGGTAQFAAIPLNLTPSEDTTADYFITGMWSQKAAKEGEKFVKVNHVLSKADGGYMTIPEQSQWNLTPGAGFVYYCANETVHGVEFPEPPDVGSVPLVCDASSNFLTRPIDIAKHAVVYAGAQKNVGCAGVTVVIVREDLLGKCRPYTPVVLDYAVTAKAKSVYNTPPVWSVYILNLVLKWIQKHGGVEGI